MARFHLRALHDVHNQWAFTSRLDRAALRDLRWWAAFKYDSPSNGAPIWAPQPTRAIYTDASSTIGYGCVLEDVRTAPRAALKPTGYLFEYPSLPGSFARDAAGGGTVHQRGGSGFGGYWSPQERHLLHITQKEMRAVSKGVAMHADTLRGQTVRLWEDNLAVVHILRSKTSRSPALMRELRTNLRAFSVFCIAFPINAPTGNRVRLRHGTKANNTVNRTMVDFPMKSLMLYCRFHLVCPPPLSGKNLA